jgi:RecA/RadA recombinase
VATGIDVIDTALDGGLPAGQLSEFVVASGGQLILSHLLETSRAARQRVALIDAMDTFAPDAFTPDSLRHLVWARCRQPEEAFSVADILVRDGNYSLVAIDLRDVPAATLNRTPKTLWHRLHRVAERQTAAVLVLSRQGLVPAVHFRLQISAKLSLARLHQPHTEFLQTLHVETLRGLSLAEKTA